MKRQTQIQAVVAAMLFSASASAATISISNIQAQWFSHVGGTNVTYNPALNANSGALADTTRISWGSGSPKSSYVFDSSNGSVLPAGDEFIVGLFTHNNNPIGMNTSITAVKLRVTFDILADNLLQTASMLDFDFTHNETDNSGTCQFPSGNNPCADIVGITSTSNSPIASFMIGQETYVLSLSGFSVGGLPVNQFITQEGVANNAPLIVKMAVTTAQVPEPASLALLGVGALGLAALRRRKSH